MLGNKNSCHDLIPNSHISISQQILILITLDFNLTKLEIQKTETIEKIYPTDDRIRISCIIANYIVDKYAASQHFLDFVKEKAVQVLCSLVLFSLDDIHLQLCKNSERTTILSNLKGKTTLWQYSLFLSSFYSSTSSLFVLKGCFPSSKKLP